MYKWYIFLDCKEGSYGVDCGNKCGHCRDVNQCLHNNGTCLTGCDAGYQGTLCEKRAYHSTEEGFVK